MAEDYGLWRYNTTPEEFKAQMGEYLQSRGIDPDMEIIFDLNDDDKLNLTRVNYIDGKSFAVKEWPDTPHMLYASKGYASGGSTAKTLTTYGAEDRETIDSIFLAEGITEIPSGALSFHTNLTHLSLPSTLTKICDYAFVEKNKYYGYDEKLTELNIPNGVTYIGEYLFYQRASSSWTGGKYGPKSVFIPNSVTYIGKYAFGGCRNLEVCNFEEGMTITNIPEGMFLGCNNLREIDIPSSVTSIGNYAFYECSGLINVIIPNGVTSIGGRAFKGVKPENFQLPNQNSVETIGDWAFTNFNYASGLYFPNIVSLNEGAFQNANVPFIEFGPNLTTFWNISLKMGNDLQYLLFESETPPTLKVDSSIGGDAITIPSTAKIYVPDSAVDTYKVANGFIDLAEQIYPISQKGEVVPTVLEPIGDKAILTLDNGEVVHVPAYSTSSSLKANEVPSNTVSIVTTDNVIRISNNVGAGLKSLTSVTISDTVTSLGGYVFWDCPNLKFENIVWGENVRKIENGAFMENPQFKNITLPDSIVTIDGYAFNHCENLETITFGENLSSVKIFAFCGCSNLKSVTFNSIVYLQAAPTTFDSNNCTFYVNKEYEEFYTYNRVWRELSSRIRYYEKKEEE